MAHNNTEIEIKYPVSKLVFAKVKKTLAKIATVEKESHEIDTYYNAPHRDFLAPKYAYEYLRLRHKNGKCILNYKHLYPEDKREKTHSDEYETALEKHDQIQHILTSLNFKEYLVVDKKRITFDYKGELEIAMDEVKGLGLFIEIETKKDSGTVTEARKAITAFAKKIGIATNTRDKDGYVLALMKKKGLR